MSANRVERERGFCNPISTEVINRVHGKKIHRTTGVGRHAGYVRGWRTANSTQKLRWKIRDYGDLSVARYIMGNAMRPYFFDIVTSKSVQHDFHGRRLAKPEDARHLAEMIALDIECCNGDRDWIATEVVVRDVRGDTLYSVSVRDPELIAA